MTLSHRNLHPTATAPGTGQPAEMHAAIAAYRARRPALAQVINGAERQRIAAGLSGRDLPLTMFALRTGGIDPEDAMAIIGLAAAMPAAARRIFEAAVLPASDWSTPTLESSD